jgi:nucleotide-binding universal stress UspA family protein
LTAIGMEIPWTRILLATEHTEFDVGAERLALDLARQRGLRLTGVLPIVSNDEYESVAPEFAARAEEAVHARVVALRDDAARAGVDLDLRIRRGEAPWREIVAEARSLGADLVVARRRGKQGLLANLLVGEMVGKVAAHAPCSVLLVPRAAQPWSHRVLAAVDDPPAAASVAEAAARVAAAGRLPLLMVSVAVHDTPDGRAAAEAAVAGALRVAGEMGVAAEGRIAVGRVADAIATLAAESGADLTVVGRGGPGSLGRLRLGGNAHRIVGLAAGAVLVVKP